MNVSVAEWQRRDGGTAAASRIAPAALGADAASVGAAESGTQRPLALPPAPAPPRRVGRKRLRSPAAPAAAPPHHPPTPPPAPVPGGPARGRPWARAIAAPPPPGHTVLASWPRVDRVRIDDLAAARSAVAPWAWTAFAAGCAAKGRAPRLAALRTSAAGPLLLVSPHVARGSFKKVHVALGRDVDRPMALVTLRIGELGASTAPDNRTRLTSAADAWEEYATQLLVRAPTLLGGPHARLRLAASGKVCWLAPLAECSASRLMARVGQPLPEVARSLLWQVGGQAARLEAHGVVHMDLKPGNVLVHRDGVLHLGDFGRVGWLAEPGASGGCGTYVYMSPEVLAGSPATQKLHGWSLGVCALELMRGAYLFSAVTPPASAHGGDGAGGRCFLHGMGADLAAFAAFRARVLAAAYRPDAIVGPPGLVSFFYPLLTEVADGTSAGETESDPDDEMAPLVGPVDGGAAEMEGEVTPLRDSDVAVARWIFARLLDPEPSSRADVAALLAFLGAQPDHDERLAAAGAQLAALPPEAGRAALLAVMRAQHALTRPCADVPHDAGSGHAAR